MALVEAAGIEPASRDISRQASTCVADHFVFAPRNPGRQGFRNARGQRFLVPAVAHVNQDDPELAAGFWASPEKARSRGYMVMQPLRG